MNLLPISIYLLLNYADEALPKTFTECSAILRSRYLYSTLHDPNYALQFVFLVPLSIRT
jgi:hypothetical protein